MGDWQHWPGRRPVQVTADIRFIIRMTLTWTVEVVSKSRVVRKVALVRANMVRSEKDQLDAATSQSEVSMTVFPTLHDDLVHNLGERKS